MMEIEKLKDCPENSHGQKNLSLCAGKKPCWPQLKCSTWACHHANSQTRSIRIFYHGQVPFCLSGKDDHQQGSFAASWMPCVLFLALHCSSICLSNQIDETFA